MTGNLRGSNIMVDRRALPTVLAGLVLLAMASAPSFAWKFVSMADSRGSDNGVSTTVLSKIIARVNSERPDLVIFQGDSVGGSSDDQVFASQFDTWVSAMSKLKCPWYFTPGNHESQSPNAEAIMQAKLNQPQNGPVEEPETTFSFDHKDAHFVALNGYHADRAHHLQTAWLSDDLARNRRPHVFVMTHDPAYPAGPHKGSSLDRYPAERDKLWDTMVKGRVRVFFCGHEHLYERTGHSNIVQVINGSCGAPLYSGVPGTIGKYHFVVVEIDGDNVRCAAKDIDGKVIDSWNYSLPPITHRTPHS